MLGQPTRPNPEFPKTPASKVEVRDLHLVTQRKPLEDVVPHWWMRWLLRKVFSYYGFACRSHCGECDGSCYASVETRGVFDDEATARWAANCPGGAVKPIPFNAALPEETVKYKTGDVPLSEASPWYRRGVALPFEAVSRRELDRLREKMRETDHIVEGFKTKIA
jgi:hypothetical protein